MVKNYHGLKGFFQPKKFHIFLACGKNFSNPGKLLSRTIRACTGAFENTNLISTGFVATGPGIKLAFLNRQPASPPTGGNKRILIILRIKTNVQQRIAVM